MFIIVDTDCLLLAGFGDVHQYVRVREEKKYCFDLTVLLQP